MKKYQYNYTVNIYCGCESGTTIQRTRPKGGFLLLAKRTLHRTSFDYSPPAAHPFGASATSALFNAYSVSPSPGTTIQRTRPKGGFLLLENSYYSLLTELCFNSA